MVLNSKSAIWVNLKVYFFVKHAPSKYFIQAVNMSELTYRYAYMSEIIYLMHTDLG